MKLRGFFVVIEGLDQSGKKTQTMLLASRLRKKGYDVEMVSFPDYSTPVGKEIRMFLDGAWDFSPEVRQFLYVANRWERKKNIETWLKSGKTVIADRYMQSNLAYGIVNGLDLRWMLSLEQGLPKSDITIVIDVSVDTAFKRKEGRDVYERNREFLNKIRAAYLRLAKRFGWFVVDGEAPIEAVAENIWKIVSKFRV